MTSESDDRLERQLVRALEQRVEELDDTTLSRLQRARQRALAAGEEQHRTRWWRPGGDHSSWPGGAVRWAGAVAGIALLALGLAVWQQIRDQGLPLPGDDLEVLASSEDLMLYRQLDFYLWLERQQEMGGQEDGDRT